jgi:hypothetical protein
MRFAAEINIAICGWFHSKPLHCVCSMENRHLPRSRHRGSLFGTKFLQRSEESWGLLTLKAAKPYTSP